MHVHTHTHTQHIATWHMLARRQTTRVEIKDL